jgi:hypothetical protein
VPVRLFAKNIAKSLTIFLDHLEFNIGPGESAKRRELLPQELRGAIEFRVLLRTHHAGRYRERIRMRAMVLIVTTNNLLRQDGPGAIRMPVLD